MRELLPAAREFAHWLSEARRAIHRNPELGFQEEKTASLVERRLTEMGISHRRCFGVGVVALIKGSAPGPCVALRADMDALPITDAKEGEVRSLVDGVMHACGHDAHTACLLGAARLLSERSFAGSVKLIFQPGEETDSGGARPMIGEGVLERPRVEAVFGLHADPGREVGYVAVAPGKMMASSDMFDAVVRGKGGHGAHPEGTVDALYAACQCVSALQSIISRNVAPTDSAVVTVGTLHSGTARNIVPAEAKFSGIIRTLDAGVRANVNERLESLLRGVCDSLGAEIFYESRQGYPVLENDERATAWFAEAAGEIVGSDRVLGASPSMGVEDFAYFAAERPGCFFSLGVRNEARGIVHPLHSNRFDIDEAALPVGAALLAGAALRALEGLTNG